MGVRTIVVLLVLVSGLSAVLWFSDRRPPTKDVAEIAVLEGRSLTQCLRLRWQFHDRMPVEIARQADGRFHLTEPIADLASAAYLKQIVDAWDSAQMRATPLADDDDGRRRAGLSPPEMTFAAEFPDGVRVAVEVGAPGPLGTTRFLRTAGRIWEGGEALIESMRVGLEDLRERSVFRHAALQADELKVVQQLATGARETLHLKRAGTDWRLVAPVQGRADPVAAQRFVTAVLSLRVDHFLTGATRFPASEPRIVIDVRGDHGEESLRLWDEGGQLYGALPGRKLAFVSDNRQFVDVFDNAADQLRARVLVPLGQQIFEELVELVVDPGQGRGDRLRLRRESPSEPWYLHEPVEFAAAPGPCNEAAEALQLLVAREFVDEPTDAARRADDQRYGLGAGRLTVLLRGVRDRQPTTIWFGGETVRGDQSLLYACRADEPDTVMLVQAANVATLRRPWTEYCARQVLRQTAIVERLDLARPDGAQRRYVLQDGAWSLEGTPGDRREVGEFANEELRDLVGSRVVDARGNAFGDAHWSVRLMRRNGDELGLLRVWDRGAGQPLLVQAAVHTSVAFELGKRQSSELRALWQ